MKNNEEMYKSLLSRFDEYQEKKRKRILIIKRTVPVLACLCIATVLGFGHWERFAKRPDPSANSGIVEISTATATADSSAGITTYNTEHVSTTVSVSGTETKASASTTSAGNVKVTASRSVSTTAAVTHTRPVSDTAADSQTNALSARNTSTTAAVTHTQPVTDTAAATQTTAATGIALVTTTTEPFHGKPQSSTEPIVTATTTEPPFAPATFPTIRLYSTYSAEEQVYSEMKIGQPIEILTDYDPVLSSPSGIGILLKIESEDYTVSLSAEKGEFRTWDIVNGSGSVNTVGRTYYIGNSGYIFWAPGKITNTENYKCTIWIKGYNGAQYVNIARITVTTNDDRTFSAVLNGK